MTAPPVGTALPSLTLPPLSRTTLALYAGGSGDHVPLHIDAAFARGAGYPDVFMHGMLGTGYLTRALTAWVPPEAIRDFAVRFTAITYPGETLTARGQVAAAGVEGHPAWCRVEVELVNDQGERKQTGYAVVDFDKVRTS